MKAYFEEFETKTFHLAGSRFYFVSGIGAVDVKINSGGDTRSYKLTSGKVINSDDRFVSVEITNYDVEQEIEFDVTDREITDHGILGVVSVSPEGGVMPVEQTGVVKVSPEGGVMPVVGAAGSLAEHYISVTGNSAMELLPENLNRVKASLYFYVDTWLGGLGVSTKSSFPFPAGSYYEHKSTAPLWVKTKVAGHVAVLEDLR